MKFAEIVENEYKDVSETVVDKLVSPKKMKKLMYERIPMKNSYAESLHALRDSYVGKKIEVPSNLWYQNDGRKIIRPLTFRENLLARVDDFETLRNKDGSKRTMEQRSRFFHNRSLDSCTGIAYSSNNDDFMIIPVCKELITLPRNFNSEYISIDYARFQGKGFSLKRSQAEYNQRMGLTKSEVIYHPAWVGSVEGDMSLLFAYVSIIFDQILRQDKAMGFWLQEGIGKEQLTNLSVMHHGFRFRASSLCYVLTTNFLRATSLS